MTTGFAGRLAAGLAAGTLLLGGTAAVAQPRPSTTDMTCAQARGFVQARGAAVIGTGGFTFDRFVRDRSFCQATEVTQTAFAPTRDDRQCQIGFQCIERNRTDDAGGQL